MIGKTVGVVRASSTIFWFVSIEALGVCTLRNVSSNRLPAALIVIDQLVGVDVAAPAVGVGVLVGVGVGVGPLGGSVTVSRTLLNVSTPSSPS